MTLRIASAIFSPLVFNCSIENLRPHQNCSYPGADAEILGSIIALLNVPYKIYPQLQVATNWGSFANDTWTGLLGMVYNGTVDTLLPALIQISERIDYFEFSFPIHQSVPVMIVKRHSVPIYNSAMLVFRVFEMPLWLTVGVLAVGIMLVLSYFHRFAESGEIVSNRGQMWHSLEFVLNRRHRLHMNSMAGRTLLFWLGAMMVLMMGLYQGCLLTQLITIPLYTYPFKNSEQLVDLVAAKELYLITTDMDQWFVREILYSNLTYFKRLKSAVSQNPLILEPNVTKALEMVETGPYILPEESRRANYLLQNRCGLMAISSEDGIPEQWLGFIFQKSSPWLPKFKHAMIKLQEHTNYISLKYGRFSQSCEENDRLGVDSISLRSLTGLFLMLFLSCLLATGVFFLEIYFAKRHGRALRLARTKTRALASEHVKVWRKFGMTGTNYVQDEENGGENGPRRKDAIRMANYSLWRRRAKSAPDSEHIEFYDRNLETAL